MTKQMISCTQHGEGETVFVCEHLLQSVKDSHVRGLFQWHDTNGNVCAWCNECAARAEASGSGPNRTPLQFKVETLCPKCFDPVRQLNRGGILYR
jgi:hypothetical protein